MKVEQRKSGSGRATVFGLGVVAICGVAAWHSIGQSEVEADFGQGGPGRRPGQPGRPSQPGQTDRSCAQRFMGLAGADNLLSRQEYDRFVVNQYEAHSRSDGPLDQSGFVAQCGAFETAFGFDNEQANCQSQYKRFADENGQVTEQAMLDFAAQYFVARDSDGDSNLDRAEFCDAVRTAVQSANACGSVFDTISGGDGSVDESEFRTFILKYVVFGTGISDCDPRGLTMSKSQFLRGCTEMERVLAVGSINCAGEFSTITEDNKSVTLIDLIEFGDGYFRKRDTDGDFALDKEEFCAVINDVYSSPQ